MKIIYIYFTLSFLIAAGLFTANRAAAQTSGSLFNEIARLDSLQFAAFNARQLDQLMNYFDPSLELYQDNTGVRNFDETKQAFGGVFKMGYVLTRKLIAGTMEVYPIKDYGAIETGRQPQHRAVRCGSLDRALKRWCLIFGSIRPKAERYRVDLGARFHIARRHGLRLRGGTCGAGTGDGREQAAAIDAHESDSS